MSSSSGAVRTALWIIAACALGTYVFLYAKGLPGLPIRSDGVSYYVYAPSWFLFHDPTMRATARDCCGGAFPVWTAIDRRPPVGAWVDAHPLGVAVFMSPGFWLADLLTRWSNLPRDGFSFYYQHAAGLTGVAALILALAILARAVSRRFSSGVVTATLVSITFGTNLFHYGTFDSVYSHVFACLLIAALIDHVPRWLEQPTMRRSVGLGVVAALLFLVRNLHVLTLGGFAAYGVWNRETLVARLRWVRRQWRAVLVTVTVAVVGVSPQFLTFYASTGRFFVDAYGPDRSFTFAAPHLYDVLFSVAKGVYFWSPLLLLATAGVFWLRRVWPEMIAPMVIILPMHTYVIASWFDWQLGDSFGHRGFTDVLPLFAVGLAALYARVAATSWRAPVAVVSAAAVLLSTAQMVQYWLRILPGWGMTWATYTRLFLRFSR